MNGAKTKRISGGEIVLLTVLILFLFVVIYRPASTVIAKIIKAEKERPYKIMAVEYLREKYGIDAEVIDVYTLVENMATVNMKCAGREINVQISNGHIYEADFIADDYQHEEIENALLNKIEESLPGGYEYTYEIAYEPGKYAKHYSMFGKDQFFDGTNLDEVMKDHTGNITMFYADTEFDDCEIFNWLQEYRIDARFISFNSQEILNEAIEFYYPFRKISPFDAMFADFAPHISDIRKIRCSDNINTNTNYAVKEYDNFLYWCPENEEIRVSVSEIDIDTIIDNFVFNDKGEYVSKPLSKAYEFDNSKTVVCVYFPLSEIHKYNDGNFRIAWHAYGSNWIDDYEIFGEYAVFFCPKDYTNPAFMLVEPVEEDAVV